MNLYFLDAGGAGLGLILIGALVLFMALCVLVEAIVMLVMNFNKSFKKAFLDSLLANLASLAVGFIMIYSDSSLLDSYEPGNMAILYAITVGIEFGILYLLNKTHPPGKTLLVSLVMNIPSYIALYFIGNA